MTPAILDRLEKVRKAPGGWTARCPAHADRGPSLSIGIGENEGTVLHCFAGCAPEDIVAAVGLRMRDLFADADEPIGPKPERRVVEVPQPMPEDIVSMELLVDKAAIRLYGQASDHPAVRYAASRFGVTLEDVHRLGLGYAVMGGGPRLVVPFRNGWGRARGFQARALDPDAQVRWLSPRNPQRGSWSRAGWFRGRERDAPIIVTEGPGDALSAVSMGFHAIAIRGASNAEDAHTQDLVMAWSAGRHLIVCGDGDEAGERFSGTLALALQGRGAWVTEVPMPPGADLTDLRAHAGADWVRSFV